MKKSFKKSMKLFLAGIIVLASAYVPIHTHAAEPNQRIISEELLQKIQELQEKHPDQLIERKQLTDYEYYQIFRRNQEYVDLINQLIKSRDRRLLENELIRINSQRRYPIDIRGLKDEMIRR
ncbi:MAG: hypothetical protein K5865_03405 [Eubacterium sp.]|nr:hypothetical protein [Eubacterium sp.]